MARPNIKFRIIDESFTVPTSEEFSQTIGAVYDPTDNLKVRNYSRKINWILFCRKYIKLVY